MTSPLLILDEKLTVSSEMRKTATKLVPEDNSRTAKALSSVITYILADAFDLSGDEVIRTAFSVSSVISPLERLKAGAVLVAVQEELKYRNYSDKLFDRTEKETSITKNMKPNRIVKYAPLSVWVEGLSEIVTTSYPDLPPMQTSIIVGAITNLLIDLGLTEDPSTTRPSLYLPNSIRYLLSN